MSKSKLSKNNSKEASLRASLGIVKDYYTTVGNDVISNSPNPTQQEMDAYLEIYEADAIIAGAIDTVGEEAVKNGGYFIGSDSAIKTADKKFEELDFLNVAEIHVKTQHIFGDSFVELKSGDDGEPVKEIHNLETTEMWIGYDRHGDIKRYAQRPQNLDSSKKWSDVNFAETWDPENVVFLPLKRIGSKVRSYSPLAPARKGIIARAYGNEFIKSTFQNFRPQTILSIENNMSTPQVDALVSAIRAADKDPSKKILNVGGELKVNTTGMYDFKRDIIDILNYMRQEVLTVTKVPGIYVGITSDSNRGVGEFQANAFQSHLLRLQRDIEKLANLILEKSGIKAKFKMRPPSIKSQTDIIDQAKKLRDMGYGDDIITPFLYENGISIPNNAKFEEQNEVSMDDMPSREASDKTVLEKGANLNENGRSKAGKEKEAERDSKMRSSMTNMFGWVPKLKLARFLK